MRSIRFVHDPRRPSADVTGYEASVRVSVSDGELTSEVALSRIEVTIANLPPVVTLGNSTTGEIIMQDGKPVIQVVQVGADIIEDSDTILRVTLMLTNPFHASEQLYALRGNVSPFITVQNGSNSVTLQGPASVPEFINALNSIEVLYSYPPMESILQGDIPDFTPRLVVHL